jgi:hypothetical protein
LRFKIGMSERDACRAKERIGEWFELHVRAMDSALVAHLAQRP